MYILKKKKQFLFFDDISNNKFNKLLICYFNNINNYKNGMWKLEIEIKILI